MRVLPTALAVTLIITASAVAVRGHATSAGLRVGATVTARCALATAPDGVVRVRCTRGSGPALLEGATARPIALRTTAPGVVEGAARATPAERGAVRTVTILF
jgi:hypothetical protein